MQILHTLTLGTTLDSLILSRGYVYFRRAMKREPLGSRRSKGERKKEKKKFPVGGWSV